MKKLYRNNENKIGGVCSGIASYLNVDETVIRLIFTLLLFTPFPIITTYIIFWIIVPIHKS